MGSWQLQTAKQRFSEVIREVEAGEPQFITKNGKEVAAIIDMEDYRRSHTQKQSFAEYLLSAPRILEDNEDFETIIGPRQIDRDRSVGIFD